MKSALLVITLVFSLPLAVLAASVDWTDAAVQELYKSACAKRTPAWTAEMNSLSALNQALANYADWLNKADSQGSRACADREWVSDLIEKWNQQKLEFPRFGQMKEAMRWREKLISFAGEEAVTKLDKSIPQRALEPSDNGFGSEKHFEARYKGFAPVFQGPVRGDFGCGQVRYVPGIGLEKEWR